MVQKHYYQQKHTGRGVLQDGNPCVQRCNSLQDRMELGRTIANM